MTGRLPAIVLSLLAAAFMPRGAVQLDLEEVLQQCDKRRQEYIAAFRDLTAVETWVTEVLNKSGMTDKQRTVMSDLYVYRSRFKVDLISEYRITREVDGKGAGNPTREATTLFRALARAKTLEQEDRALREQNIRHVLRFIVTGLTVNPLGAVQGNRRQNFTFAISGRERLGEQDVIVLTYESKTLLPVEPATIYKHFKSPRRGNRGRAWLDAKDYRIRRWIDDLMIVDDEITTAAVLMHKDIDYEWSALGVLPKRIAISTFDKSGDKKSPHLLRPIIRQSFTYDSFKRFDVTTATEIGKLEDK